MKIAISSSGPSQDSPVDLHFGRAKYFHIYDLDTTSWSVHDNTCSLDTAHGAGIQAAQAIVDLGVEVVLTGNCGPKAFSTLKAAEVDIYSEAKGTVKGALWEYAVGRLNLAEGENVTEGFGNIQ